MWGGEGLGGERGWGRDCGKLDLDLRSVRSVQCGNAIGKVVEWESQALVPEETTSWMGSSWLMGLERPNKNNRHLFRQRLALLWRAESVDEFEGTSSKEDATKWRLNCGLLELTWPRLPFEGAHGLVIEKTYENWS